MIQITPQMRILVAVEPAEAMVAVEVMVAAEAMVASSARA